MGEGYIRVTSGRCAFAIKVGLLYTGDGIWLARDEGTGVVRLGLSDFRQQTDGQITFVDLPERGMSLDTGEEVANVETVQAGFSISAPFSGTVTALNACLGEAPEAINEDPYGKGWLIEMKPDCWPACGDLLDDQAYCALVASLADEARL